MAIEPSTQKKGPIRTLFQNIMGQSAEQGWMIGMMESAAVSLELVRDEARANLNRVPNDKLSVEANEKLTRAINDIRELAANLERISIGEGRK